MLRCCSGDHGSLQWGPRGSAVGTLGTFSGDHWALQKKAVAVGTIEHCSGDHLALHWGTMVLQWRHSGPWNLQLGPLGNAVRTNSDYFCSGCNNMSLYPCIVLKVPNSRTLGHTGGQWRLMDTPILDLRTVVSSWSRCWWFLLKRCALLHIPMCRQCRPKWRPLWGTFGGQWTSVMTSRGYQGLLLSFPDHYRPLTALTYAALSVVYLLFSSGGR